MKLIDRVHHITAGVKALANAPGAGDDATVCDAGVVVAGMRDLVRAAQAVQVVVMSRLEALDAFRAHGAHDVASMLRLSGESPFVAKQVAHAVRSSNSFPAITARLLDGSMRREQAAAMVVLIDHAAGGHLSPDEIDRLLAHAPDDTNDGFKQRVAQYQLLAEQRAGIDRAERQRAASKVTVSDADDGMKRLVALLDPTRHAVLVNALDELVDQNWRDPHRAPGTYELPKLRADALTEMARRSIEGQSSAADRATSASSASSVSSASTRTGRAQVVVLIDHRTLIDGLLREGSRCELADGTPISPETARRLACEAGVIPVVLGSASQPLDVGRRKRLATHAQRIALRLRSRTCEFPGCTVPHEWTKAHHVNPWKPGGLTDLEQLVALCTKHHGLVHEGGWTIERIDGLTVFRTPGGIAYNGPIASAA